MLFVALSHYLWHDVIYLAFISLFTLPNSPNTTSPLSHHIYFIVHIAMPYLVVYIWMFVTSLCWKIYIKVLVYSVNILGSSLGHTGSNLVVQILAFLCIFCVKLQLINLSNNRPLSSQLIQSCIAKHKVYSTFKNGSLLVWKLTSDLSIVPALLSQ